MLASLLSNEGIAPTRLSCRSNPLVGVKVSPMRPSVKPCVVPIPIARDAVPETTKTPQPKLGGEDVSQLSNVVKDSAAARSDPLEQHPGRDPRVVVQGEVVLGLQSKRSPRAEIESFLGELGDELPHPSP